MRTLFRSTLRDPDGNHLVAWMASDAVLLTAPTDPAAPEGTVPVGAGGPQGAVGDDVVLGTLAVELAAVGAWVLAEQSAQLAAVPATDGPQAELALRDQEACFGVLRAGQVRPLPWELFAQLVAAGTVRAAADCVATDLLAELSAEVWDLPPGA